MIAQDLITRLQTIVHEHGLGLKDVVIDINGLRMQLADIDDIKILEDGRISLVMGDWKNEDSW